MSFETDDDVVALPHFIEQWDERTPDDSVDVHIAWAEAKPLPGVARGDAFDEARYHPPTDTVLLRCLGELVTVYERDVDEEPEIWAAVDAQYGGMTA